MTATTVQIIITREGKEQKINLGSLEEKPLEKLDEQIRLGMQTVGKALYLSLLEAYDDRIMGEVPVSWKNVGREKRQLMTCLGWVQYKRRIYQDETGRRRKPLDERLKIGAYHRHSISLQQKGSFLASELPYREASEVLSWLVGDDISHSTIGRMVQQVGDSYQAEAEYERRRVFEFGGDLKPGRVPAKVLYGESDGVWISLQHEKKRKAEVRVGIFYTGKKMIGVKRKALVNKVAVTKIVTDSQEWQETLLKTACQHYDLSTTKQLMVGGDGNSWVRRSFNLLDLPRDFVLDRYHLYREARRAFGFTEETDDWITTICEKGLKAVLPDMLEVIAKAPPKKAEKMREFIQYMINNKDGLLDPDCRTHLKVKAGNLGAIEGNVDKLVVRRLKGRGRSWSLHGAQAMLAVCRHKTELKQNAFHPFDKEPMQKTRRKRYRRRPVDGDWCQVRMPALHEIHANRPWARTLRDIAHPREIL